MSVPFLTDEWFAGVHELVVAHGAAPTDVDVIVNATITDGPFDGGDQRVHFGVKDGVSVWGKEHADRADATVTTDYETARAVFISGNPQAGMQAFLAGKIKTQGDLSKLIQLQAQPNEALQSAIQAFTD